MQLPTAREIIINDCKIKKIPHGKLISNYTLNMTLVYIY